jgi:hypothetical protein
MHVTTQTRSAMLTTLKNIIGQGHLESRTLAIFSAYLRLNLVPASVSSYELLTQDECARQESSQRIRREMEEARFRREVGARVKVEVEAALRRQNRSARPNRTRASAPPLRDEGSYFDPPRNVHQSFYADSHSAGADAHSTDTVRHSAGIDTPFAGTGGRPVQQIASVFTKPFYIHHEDEGFQERYPHANLEEYQSREIEEAPVEDEDEVIPEAPRRSARPTYRAPSLPSEPPSLPTSGAVNVPLITSSHPGVSSCVEKWVTGHQIEDANEEAEVVNNAETIPKPKVSTQVSVAEPEQPEPVPVVDKGESAIVVGDTDMAEAEPETNGQSADETEASGNIQHDFSSELESSFPITGINGETQETNGEIETPEDSQDTSQGNSIFTVLQVNDTQLTQDSAYASQEEVCDLIDRMDDAPSYRARTLPQLRRSSPPIADEDAPRYELRSAARQQRHFSPLVADNAVLGKRSRSSDARDEDVSQHKITKLSTSDAQQTANELVGKVAFAELRATRERITAAAENADDDEL